MFSQLGYQDPKEVHPATLVDVGSRIFCCFGPTCQDKCRCGVVRDDEEEEEQEEDIEKEKEKVTEKQNVCFIEEYAYLLNLILL